ncbi:MAG TPA: hypothetical protein VER96_04700 [Polyangiaceae bacterium]|nr:hypothetical protein [Polyangiaceae bacterium]
MVTRHAATVKAFGVADEGDAHFGEPRRLLIQATLGSTPRV